MLIWTRPTGQVPTPTRERCAERPTPSGQGPGRWCALATASLLAVVLGAACAPAPPPSLDGGSDGSSPDGSAPDAGDGTVCQPACSARECGDDGCGGVCGACEPGYACDTTGRCIPDGCQEGCPVLGLRECTTTAELRRCGDDDADGCLDWLAPEPCPAGSTCQQGACVPDGAIAFLVQADTPTSAQVRPVWNRTNIWDVTGAPAQKPHPYFEEAVLMTATGGRTTCEMYHEDAGGTPTYDFSPLDSALDNLRSAGIRPIVVVGNTPIDLSDRPGDQGAFDANTGAPTDTVRYGDFLRELAAHLVSRYPAPFLQTLGFRLMTEPDNTDWWAAGLDAYQRLYDYTLAALRAGGLQAPLDVGNYMTPVGPAAWTEQMAAWVASPPPPQVLFADDFGDGAPDGWQVHSGTAQVVAGQLSVSDGLVSAGSAAWEDYAVTATVQTVQPGADPWLVGWLLFRFADPGNYYALGLHADGYLELARRVGGTWQGLLDVAQTGLSPLSPHVFRVEVDGQTVRAYVDGVRYVEHGAPGGSPAGGVGLWAWASPEVRLDDATVEYLSAHDPGALPRLVERVSFSAYGRGQMSVDPRDLAPLVESVRQAVTPHLGSVRISVDEGMILFDEAWRRLWLGDGTELGAAWNAAIFKIAHDVDLERYVQWGFTIDGLKSPSYNVVESYAMLQGGSILQSGWSGAPALAGSYVDGLAAALPGGRVGVLVFSFNADRGASAAQPVTVALRSLPPLSPYRMTHYRVDADHSNFFSQWLADSTLAGISLRGPDGADGSPYDLAVPLLLSTGDGGLQLWQQQRATYDALDDLEALQQDVPVASSAAGELTLAVTLPPNAVSLLLLSP